MELCREKIIQELRKALDIRYHRNVIASRYPLPERTGVRQICIGMPRFIFPLSGEKRICLAKNGKIVCQQFVPGEILQIPVSSWSIEEWDCRHSMISIVILKHFLRVIYIEHDGLAAPPPKPDFFFHTREPLCQAGIEVFNALRHLREESQAIDDLFHGFLKIVLEQLENDATRTVTKEGMTWENARGYAEVNFSKAITRKSIASALRLHPAHVSHLFQKYAGCGCAEYITHLRMEHAILLLEDPTLTIGEIADLCGYASVSYFIRVFHRMKMTSPMKYRESLLAGQWKKTEIT